MPYFQNINLDKKIRAYAPKNKKDYIFNRHNLLIDIIFFNCLGQFSYWTSLTGGGSPLF